MSVVHCKQSFRSWIQALDVQLKLMGFEQSTSDPCIYTSTTESDGLFVLAVYVDDILLAGKFQWKMAQIKADPGKQFQLNDMGCTYLYGLDQILHLQWPCCQILFQSHEGTLDCNQTYSQVPEGNI